MHIKFKIVCNLCQTVCIAEHSFNFIEDLITINITCPECKNRINEIEDLKDEIDTLKDDFYDRINQ